LTAGCGALEKDISGADRADGDIFMDPADIECECLVDTMPSDQADRCKGGEGLAEYEAAGLVELKGKEDGVGGRDGGGD